MEDALLAQLQNAHLKDDDDKRADNDSDVSENEQSDQEIQNEPIPSSVMMRQGGRQTGPKGVIDDQKYQQSLEAYQKKQRIQEHNAKLLSKAPTTTTYREDELLKQLQQQQQQRGTDVLILEPPTHKEDDDDEEQHRLFGKYEEIHPDDYVLSIDNEWKTVPVIVHLYDNTLDHCKQLDQILHGLAQKYCLAKFVRVSALALEFDLVGSPAILAYKSGILMANLVRLDDEVGPAYTVESVEDVLLR
ncbi:thioredoxin-like protein [Cunninghamella echinulata]|nr:thioredoxin-like protein [Cunninghamella echinulata]